MRQTLLFDTTTWLVYAAPFVGILAGAISRRTDPRIESGKVLRHDAPARITHWTHGIGTAVLLLSGMALGFLFVPSILGARQQVWTAMNLHFMAVVVFLFGTFYYGANALLAPKRFMEHLPTGDAVEYTKRHYGLLLGFKHFTMPPERKYFESEKVAYLMAVAGTITTVVSGMLKVAAHSVNMPSLVMGVSNAAHDVATVVMLLFILPHIFFAAILPVSWPILRSMFTGYVPLDYAEHEHAGWVVELQSTAAEEASQ